MNKDLILKSEDEITFKTMPFGSIKTMTVRGYAGKTIKEFDNYIIV